MSLQNRVLRRLDKNIILVILFTLLYIGYFTYVSFEKHSNFFTGRFDLGNMDQTIWNTLQGRFFTLTNPDGINTISRLAIHADFILVLLSPLYFIWQDPRMLLFVQSVVLGCGAVFVYLIAKEILKDGKLSLVFSISYLLNPFLQRQNLYDFHAVTLATTFLLAGFYFLFKEKYLSSLLFIFLAVLTKENVYLISALIGFYLLFAKKKKKLGLVVSIASILVFYFLMVKAIPDARGKNHFALSYFQDFGDSPAQIGKNIILNPHKTFSYLLTFENLDYVKNLLLPMGFLSLFSPLYLAFSVFDLAINLISSNHNLKSINFHYAATILPFLYISAMYGTRTFIKSKKFMFYYLLFFSLFSTWLLGAFPGSRSPSTEVFTDRVLYRDIVSKFVSRVPKNFSVASSNNLGAHLSQRENIYTIPNGIEKADMILFLLNDEFAQPSPKEQRRMVEELKKNKNYVQFFEKEDFIVFVKATLKDTLSL